MSRIGNKAIPIPQEISLQWQRNGYLMISKGDYNQNYQLPDGIDVAISESKLLLSAVNKADMSAFLGLHRSKINNIIAGINEDFQVDLIINGIGYKAAIDNKYLTIWLGFSHCIKYLVPDSISFQVPKPTQISVLGRDKCYVSMIARDLCDLKAYNPYKQKGIYKKDQVLFVKEVKKK